MIDMEKADKNNIKKITTRFRLIYFLFLIMGIAAIGKIISVQFLSENKIEKENIYRSQEIKAKRGSILAYDGRPLAISVPYYRVKLDYNSSNDSVFNSKVDSLALALSTFFRDKSTTAYKRELLAGKSLPKDKRNGSASIGNREISYIEMEEVRKFPLFNLGQFKGGVIFEEKYRRIKPYGSLADRTIGYMKEDGTGVGIESTHDLYLKGSSGKQTIRRQVDATWTPVFGEEYQAAKNGSDIRTTIDIDIQEVAEAALREQLALNNVLEGGVVVVMDVKSGAIRAISNMKKRSNGEFDETYNYAVGEATNPGSTFKLATLISLLEDNYVKLTDTIDAGNGRWRYSTHTFSDVSTYGYGKVSVQEAFEKSSNVAFAKLATQHYIKKEKDLISRLHSMKVTDKLDLDIKGEARAYISAPNDKTWSALSLPMISIGYEVLMTPLHTLTFYNAIANGGKMVKPYFIESYEEDGRVNKTDVQIISGSICSKKTLQEVQKALRAVVEKGTAKSYNDKRYSISGKTGTAQIADNGRFVDRDGYRKHQASFAGYFPSEDPKYSMIVVLYSEKTKENFYGGAWAAPVFKKVADQIYISSPEWKDKLDGKEVSPIDYPSVYTALADSGKAIKKVLSIPEESLISSNVEKIETMPDLTNMGLKDVIYLMEANGCKVKSSGKGKVVSQEPLPGTKLANNTTVLLKLN